MYRCHTHFYFIGRQREILKIIKGMSPLEHFTHIFSESDKPEKALAAKADVILADLREMDIKKAVQTLVSGKAEEAQFILLADKEQIALLGDNLTEITDIWTMPMSEAEIRFRFLRWQQTYKMSKDFWQTSQYLDATINNTPDLIWYKDKDGIHRKVNKSFCKTVNKTMEQIEGRGHAYIWDVEFDDPVCIESEQEVMRTKKTCVSDELIQTGEGEKCLVAYKSPLYNLDGSVMGTVGVAIDVTKERAYKQELIQKNRTLETVFTAMDCGIICHSLDGSRILSINKAILMILGYESKEELEEKGLNAIDASVLEEDQASFRESLGMLKKEGDSISVEYRIRRADGEIRYVMGNIKLLKENGELFYQRFALDCTAQKLQEKKKEKRQMELVQALSIDYNLVCYFDLDTGAGTPLRNNDLDGHLFASVFDGEISLEKSLGLYAQKFVYEEDRGMLLEAVSQENLKKELEGKKQYYVNYRVSKGDEVEYFQIKAVRAGAWDESHGIVLGLRSVDEELREEMEQKNLLKDALVQANQANKAKSVFFSNMSHDIRTPMNAIVGFTALAITHIDQKEQVEAYLKKIMTSGDHLLSLINDVLDMSRIESGKIRLDEKPCSLPEILHGLRNIVQADIHAKQLELYIDAMDIIDEEIYCDKLRLNQVLLNLLSNAVKYTRAGGTVSMRIRENTEASEGYANYEFYVKDTGIGMSEEFVHHIFEPFERESASAVNEIQGTGLGMAITKNIVDMMNGSIEVQSEQGVGTEVRVSFTFRINHEAKERPDIPELKNCRTLVVDDDFNTCDSVSYMLQQIGMRAEWTLSGKEAVLRTRQAAMRGDSYGVYIIDWLLPDMNGVEVTRRIRKETDGNVPIIVLTAYDWSDIEEEANEAGVTAFCSKPLFLSELRSCLQSVISMDEETDEENTDEESAKFYTGRILLAEDNELNQEIAVEILGEAGFTTEVAENGEIALDMLKNSEPGYYQLVLMDVQMPVMNGYQTTKAIRELENKRLSSIPIIAMTANAFEEDKRHALESGMNGHIAKPIDVEKLLETLDEVLEK